MRFLGTVLAALVLGLSSAYAQTVVGPVENGGLSHADLSGANITATGGTTARTLAARSSDVVNVRDYGVTGNGTTDDTANINLAAAAIGSSGGELLFPPGSYLISGPITLKSGTDAVGYGATIVAAPHGSWSGDKVGTALTAAAASSNITIEGFRFTYPYVGSYGASGSSPHIIDIEGGSTHIVIKYNVSDGGADFSALVGDTDTLVTGNTTTNISNSCFDQWGGAIDAKVIANYCSTISTAGNGVGGIMFTGINTDQTAANSRGFIASDNIIYINNNNSPQCIMVNGHASGGTDDKVIITHNKCYINGVSSWGILVSGKTNNGVISGNYLEGGVTTNGTYGAVSVSSSATGWTVTNNVAVNWQAGAQGVFNNAGTGGVLAGNVAYSSSSPLLGSDASTVEVFGNDSGTGAVSIANVNITSGSAAFNGTVSNTGGGPTWGWNGAGGVTETLNGAAGNTRMVRAMTAGSLRWQFILGDSAAEGGSNAGSDFDLYGFNDSGSQIGSGPLLKVIRASGHIILGGSGTPALATGATDCGTSPVIAGNDSLGRVTVGSSTNGGKCTITFAKSWVNAPVCAVSDETTASAVRPVVTTTTLAITGTLTAGDSLSYRCQGY